MSSSSPTSWSSSSTHEVSSAAATEQERPDGGQTTVAIPARRGRPAARRAQTQVEERTSKVAAYRRYAAAAVFCAFWAGWSCVHSFTSIRDDEASKTSKIAWPIVLVANLVLAIKNVRQIS